MIIRLTDLMMDETWIMVKTNKSAKWIWQQPGWPEFVWQEKALAPLLREIHKLQGKLLGNTELVTSTENLQSELDALLQNAINTSAIEGEELDVNSVRSSLAKRLGLKQAGLPPGTPQTDGIADLLLDATHHADVELTQKRLYEWHQKLFPENVPRLVSIQVGKLRTHDPMQVVSGPIGKEKVHFEAPLSKNLKEELKSFIDWFNQSRKDTEFDPLLRAGIAHLWFVTIHPFDDGNGRLARAITDLALAQAEQQSIRFYAMAAAIMENRKAYYQVLEQSQRAELDVTSWLEWFLETLKKTLITAIKRIEYVLQKTKFWQLHAQSSLNERQVKVLNRLLDSGPDEFEGGINTQKYMGLTKTSKATATRDLVELVEKGCLVKRPGGGRSTSYDISWPKK